MAADYYSVLVRAASALDPNTAESRRALYNRARLTVAKAGLTRSEVRQERLALEIAIQQVEEDLADRRQVGLFLADATNLSPADDDTNSLRPAPPETSSTSQRWKPRLLILGLAAAAVVAGGIVAYRNWPGATSTQKDVPISAEQPTREAGQLDPSRVPDEASLSYTFRRQLVFYRTIYPAGTIVIAKSQRFLYLVRPNVSALRYTIGIGRQCANLVGLLLVSSKENWAEASLRPAVSGPLQADPQEVARRADGQFGPRSLALSETGHRIHGARPSEVSSATGCFPLANEDVVDLYDRVALGTRVVMN